MLFVSVFFVEFKRLAMLNVAASYRASVHLFSGISSSSVCVTEYIITYKLAVSRAVKCSRLLEHKQALMTSCCEIEA